MVRLYLSRQWFQPEHRTRYHIWTVYSSVEWKIDESVGERLKLEVARMYLSWKFVKIPSFGFKVLLWCVITKKWQPRWIGTSRSYSLFVVDWVCYSLVTVRGVAFGEDYELQVCGETSQNCGMENRERWWRQGRPTDRWYLELVVKRLRCINYLNACATNCVSSKSCGVVPSFHITIMKRRTIQACSLMHPSKTTSF